MRWVRRSVRRRRCSRCGCCCGLRGVCLRRHRRDRPVARYCVLRQRLVGGDASSFAQREPVFLQVARHVLARHAVHVHQLRAVRAGAASACTRLDLPRRGSLKHGGRSAADATSYGPASQAWLRSRVRRGKRARCCRESREYPDPNHQHLLIGAVSEQPSALRARNRARGGSRACKIVFGTAVLTPRCCTAARKRPCSSTDHVSLLRGAPRFATGSPSSSAARRRDAPGPASSAVSEAAASCCRAAGDSGSCADRSARSGDRAPASLSLPLLLSAPIPPVASSPSRIPGRARENVPQDCEADILSPYIGHIYSIYSIQYEAYQYFRPEALRPAPQPYAWFRRAPARAGC